MVHDETKHMAGLLFVALMFIGTGIGLAFGRPDVGVCIGMGLGFVAMAIASFYRLRIEVEKTVRIRGWLGAALLLSIGIPLIAIGVAMAVLSEDMLRVVGRYIGSTVCICIGLVFVVMALNIIKPS